MNQLIQKSIFALALAFHMCSSFVCAVWENGGGAVGSVGAALSSLSEATPGSAECDLGSYVADAVRYSLGADAAIINSGDLESDFPDNVVSYTDICNVFTEDRGLALAQVSAAELCELLEGALSRITVDKTRDMIDRDASDFGGFPQISGIELTYDGSANAGERIYVLKTSDGRVIDPEDTQTVFMLAATEYMLDGGWGYSLDAEYEPTPHTLSTAVAEYISNGDISFFRGRIRVIGVNDSWIGEIVPVDILYIIIIVLLGFFVLVSLKAKKMKRNIYYARDAQEARRRPEKHK